MAIEMMENFGKFVEEEKSPRYLYYQGYDKTPALSYDKVLALSRGVVRVVGFYMGGLNYSSFDRGANNEAISFTKEIREKYLSIPSIKLAYIYVGRTDQGDYPYLISANDPEAISKGVTDAQEAEKLAKNLNIPKDSVLYLDIEGGNRHEEAIVDYAESWVDTINNNTQYWAGIYCSYGKDDGVKLGSAKQLYNGVNKQANMYIARWYADSGECYIEATDETYTTSYERPALWYDLNPEKRAPDAGCIVVQYSGNVYINLNGVKTIVDQISSLVPDPSVKQF